MNDAFENSIRNKLNEADIPFEQDAWSKMESLLDAGDKNKRPVAWWWWLFLLPLLGGMVWWIIQSSTVDKKTAGTAISVQKTDGQPVLSGGRFDEKKETNNETVNQTGKHLSDVSASPENKTNSETVTPSGKHLPDVSASPENKTNSETVTPSGKRLPDVSASPENKINNKTSDIVTSSGKITSIDGSSFIQPYDIRFIKTKNVNNYNGYTKILHTAEIPVNIDISRDLNKKNPRRKINSKGLYIGVTLGPDLNVAPSLNYGKVGFNAGILAHYYFNSRWFITTGAIYSKKLYGATSKDYTAWSNGSAPYDLVKVNANCDVLDIPVNMNYTFLQVNNNTISATLGLSNYFMLKEQYQYLYKYSPTWEKTVQNQNQHYMAILNVGALYQHPAGRRLIIGVQPYAKIPLHGVGLGQVKLYSAGVSFQLNLVSKKR
ncbi:outer membrane beta-barrel protein [Chitinophaga sp.]|uniref:outer membrane beta-barrel protein n=1 Tax=Chitinophaga sp. TaxID=1869181 RepID=UPI002F929512